MDKLFITIRIIEKLNTIKSIDIFKFKQNYDMGKN